MKRRFLMLLGLACAMAPIGAFAQQSVPAPRLDAVFPFSGQSGGKSFEVVVAGEEIEGKQELLFTHPGIKAEQVMIPADRFYPNPRPNENHFTVTVPADVPPGAYEVRLSNKLGMTNARRFIVGAEPEAVEKEPNNDSKTAMPVDVGSVVSGHTDPQQRDFFRFAAKKDQRLILHCTSRRADSLADAALTLYDASGNVLRRAHDAIRLDPTIDFTAPADGDYFVSVNDFLWGGGDKHPYRLSIGTGPWVELIDPPVTVAGTTTKHTVYGHNLPGGTPASAEFSERGQRLEKVEVTISAPADPTTLPAPADTYYRPTDGPLDAISYRLPGANNTFSNPLRVAVVRNPVTPEQKPNDLAEKAQALTLPATVIVRSGPGGGRDWFGFDAKKGDKLCIEVISRRLDQPTDPAVLVQRMEKDKDGKETLKDVEDFDDVKRLTQNVEDPRFRFEADDPAVMFTVPQDGSYRVMLRDLVASSGRVGLPQFHILSIRKPEPDFALHAHLARPDQEDGNKVPGGMILRKGGSALIEVAAFRREGFDGEIKLSVDGLPPGISAQTAVIGPAADYGAVVLQAATDASIWTGPVKIVGKATVNGAEVTRVAAAAELTAPKVDGTDVNLKLERLVCGDLVAGVRDEPSIPWSASAGEGKPWRMARAGKLEIPVKVTRAEGFKGEVKLDPQIVNQQVRAAGPVTFAGSESEKKLTLNIDANARPGAFTLYLRGVTPQKYGRNAELAKQAGEDEKRIREIRDKEKQEATKAQQAHQEADQKVPQAKQKLDESEQARVQAVQKKTEADQQEKSAGEKLTAAKTAADEAAKASTAADAAAAAAEPPAADAAKQAAEQAKQKLAEAKTALDTATKAHDDAVAAAKSADEKVAAAVKAKSDAETTLKTAQDNAEAMADADTKAKAAAQESEAAQQAAQRRNEQAKRFAEARDVRIYGYSTPVLLEVVDSPWSAKLQPEEISVKAGGQPVEVNATLTRDFDFTGDVKFELAPPEGASGLGFGENGNAVPANQNAGKLAFKAEQNAKPGQYTWTLRGRYTFNGRADLTVEKPLKVTILPADPKPK